MTGLMSTLVDRTVKRLRRRKLTAEAQVSECFSGAVVSVRSLTKTHRRRTRFFSFRVFLVPTSVLLR